MLKKPLSEIATVMESFPQVLKNVRMAQKIEIKAIPNFQETIEKLEKDLGDRGRILVRPSGTEPLIRVMVEGEDDSEINRIADDLCDIVREFDAN